MKFVIQEKRSRQEIIAQFDSQEAAQDWIDYCVNLLLIELSQGPVSIIDAVENKKVGNYL